MKLLDLISWIWEKQKPVIKGGVQVVTPNPPPDPKPFSGHWGTAVPSQPLTIKIIRKIK